jgi:hypothetical protein
MKRRQAKPARQKRRRSNKDMVREYYRQKLFWTGHLGRGTDNNNKPQQTHNNKQIRKKKIARQLRRQARRRRKEPTNEDNNISNTNNNSGNINNNNSNANSNNNSNNSNETGEAASEPQSGNRHIRAAAARRVGGRRVTSAGARQGQTSERKKRRKGKRSNASSKFVHWNCCGAIGELALKRVIKEVKRVKADCAVLVETHRSEGQEEGFSVDGYCIYGIDNKGKGKRKGCDGVMIALACNVADAHIVTPTFVNSRLMMLEVRSKAVKSRSSRVYIAAYAPTNVASAEVKDAYYEALDKLMSKIPRYASVFMGVDANGQLGKEVEPGMGRVLGPHGRDVRNENGNRLVRFAQIHGLNVVNTKFDRVPDESYTHRRPPLERGGERTFVCLDYILTKQADVRHVENFKVIDLSAEQSDHLMLSIVIKGRISRSRTKPRQAPRTRRLNTSVLANSEKKALVQEAMNEVLAGLDVTADGPTEDILADWAEQTRNVIEECAGEEPKPIRLEDWFADSTMQQDYEMARARMMDKWRELKDSKKRWGSNNVVTREAKKTYNKSKNELRALLRERESLYWLAIANQLMELNRRKDSRGFHKYVKLASGQGPQVKKCSTMENGDGSFVVGADKIRERWAEYFFGLLNVSEEETSAIDESILEELEQRATNVGLGAVPTEGEVRLALGSMKNCKAPGPDRIPAEFLKLYLDSTESVQLLTELMGRVWKKKEVPQSWKLAVIKVIFKNKGGLTKCGNYRGVSLLDHAGKVLLKVVTARLTKYAEEQGLLPEEQSGFRPKRSTTDMLYVVQMLQEFGRVKNVPLFFCFIDLTKAYDTVNRRLLWKILAKAGLPQELIELIRAFHDGTQACVRFEGEDSASFSVNQGLRQGCVLAPLLFNLFFAAVLEVARKRILADETAANDLVKVKTCMSSHPWDVKTRNSAKPEDIEKLSLAELWSMLYADDAGIVSKSEAGLTSMMNIIVQATSQFGLTVSEDKTKTMYVAKEKELEVRRVKIAVSAGGQSYGQVEHFTYLGTKLSDGGGVSSEIATRISKTWGKWKARKKSLYQNKGVRPHVKLMMLKTEVIETLMYGCAAWTTNADDIAALNSTHYKLLIQTLGLWKKKETDRPRSYSSILKEYDCVSMEATLKWRRLKWAGSVIRMGDNRLPKIMMFGELVGGVRSRGGQIGQWRTELLGDMTDFGWIKKKWGGVTPTCWEKYKALVWKEEISVMAISPEDWTAALLKGEARFMSKWHAKEEAESKERGRLRMIDLIRLRVVVWGGLLGGWRPRTVDMVGWEDFEAKWNMVRQCKEVRELRIKKQQLEDFDKDVEEGRLVLSELEKLELEQATSR